MRTMLDNANKIVSLDNIKEAAITKRNQPSKNRSDLTTRLYTALSNIDRHASMEPLIAEIAEINRAIN